MKATRPSQTAAWIAATRAALGVELPEGRKLCDDPYGMLFAGRSLPRPLASLALRTWPVLRFTLWVQLRTRFLDDTLRSFVRNGGRQIVILGAGFDCRALRFARELGGAAVFEVDHPATQREKQAVLARAGLAPQHVRYVSMDFEQEATRELPAKLAAAGHDPKQPTLTLWEGVTMYLTEPAIEATVAAVHAYCAPGSVFAFTYFDLPKMRRGGAMRLLSALVRSQGEPWRFGWSPDVLPGWLEQRGFMLRETPQRARPRPAISAPAVCGPY
jgi:methyltransferase (TIGR00027 family)